MSTPETSSAARWEPTPRWERRYREVLDAAATVFAEKGYAGASTRDIADRLSIRQASLYYYFPSKEAALAAICELGVKDFIGHLQTILAEPIPTADKLRAAITNHLAPLRSNPEADYIRVFLRHRHELPDGLRQSVAALARTYQGLVERLFVEGIAKRELRPELNPQLATLAFLGLCNSVIANRALPRSTNIDDIMLEYAEILNGGVVAPKGNNIGASRSSPGIRKKTPLKKRK
jgi:TetR/AcrR family transcriptional regulator, cholesterol catabolism regulator